MEQKALCINSETLRAYKLQLMHNAGFKLLQLLQKERLDLV